MKRIGAVLFILLSTAMVWGQSPSGESADVAALKQQLHDVASLLQQTRDELHASQKEIASLRSEVSSLRAGPAEATPAQPAIDLGTLEQQQQLLATRVDQQYQTKVESGSKYRVRLSGLVLFNASTTRGSVDEQDDPMLAEARTPGQPNGNISATLRQTLMNVDVFGPELAGAKTSAGVQFDFFGGIPATLDGQTMGIVRMRTAKLQLDWNDWSLTIGQDKPFFAPNSPTSLAAVAVPEFGYSGNLWTWTPGIVAERRWTLSDSLMPKFQFGLLDPLGGEFPSDPYARYPESGELSRVPAIAARQSLSFGAGADKSSIGGGVYFARHDYGYARSVDSWAGTLDWKVLMGRYFEASGAFYRGVAIGGLWGGIGASAVFDGPPNLPTSQVFPVNTIGGWSQIKFKPAAKWEINGAFGEDSPFSADLRHYNEGFSYQPYLRNWSTMFNVIERPKSNLMFSLEYRHLNSVEFTGHRDSADNINLGAGVSF